MIELTHPNGTRVTVHLPAPMGFVGETLIALGELGYRIPAAANAQTVTIEADLTGLSDATLSDAMLSDRTPRVMP